MDAPSVLLLDLFAVSRGLIKTAQFVSVFDSIWVLVGVVFIRVSTVSRGTVSLVESTVVLMKTVHSKVWELP